MFEVFCRTGFAHPLAILAFVAGILDLAQLRLGNSRRLLANQLFGFNIIDRRADWRSVNQFPSSSDGGVLESPSHLEV